MLVASQLQDRSTSSPVDAWRPPRGCESHPAVTDQASSEPDHPHCCAPALDEPGFVFRRGKPTLWWWFVVAKYTRRSS